MWQQTTAGNLHWVHEGPVHCIVLGPKQWDDAEWDEFVEVASKTMQTGKTVSINVFMAPLNVTAQQRKRTSERAKRTQFARMAVLTDSAVVRGVTTAFGWLMPGPTIKAYRPDELRSAIDWLAVEVPMDAALIEAGMRARIEELRRRDLRSGS